MTALVHHLQRAVMAQAAARAYPGTYRMLGGVVGGQEPGTAAARDDDDLDRLLDEQLRDPKFRAAYARAVVRYGAAWRGEGTGAPATAVEPGHG